MRSFTTTPRLQGLVVFKVISPLTNLNLKDSPETQSLFFPKPLIGRGTNFPKVRALRRVSKFRSTFKVRMFEADQFPPGSPTLIFILFFLLAIFPRPRWSGIFFAAEFFKNCNNNNSKKKAASRQTTAFIDIANYAVASLVATYRSICRENFLPGLNVN